MATEMPNWVYATKSSFAAGELTPTIEGRADLPLYQSGAKKIINWMILPSGSLTRRPGTKFIWGQPINARVLDQDMGGISLGTGLFDYGILDKEDAAYSDLHRDKK